MTCESVSGVCGSGAFAGMTTHSQADEAEVTNSFGHDCGGGGGGGVDSWWAAG